MKRITYLLVLFAVAFTWQGQAQCDYTLEMNDSYGDGWNGNTMDVLVGGVVVLDDVTIASGSQNVLTFSVNTGDDVTAVWNAGGSWGSETSYKILDNSGTEVGAAAQADIASGTITAACPIVSCNYSLEMNDSYGDGWNGNTMDVLVAGVVVLDDVTISSGSQSVLSFSVNEGDDVTAVWNAGGSWGSETSYKILDPSGTEVAAAAEADIVSGTITAACPSCIVPTDLAVANLTTTSAELSWTAGADETLWDIEWGAIGFTQGSGTVVTGVTNPYVLSGLTSGTSYDFYVLADCGSGLSTWAGPFSFMTQTTPVAIPSCADFEANDLGGSISLTTNAESSASISGTAGANSSAYGVLLTGGGSSGWTGWSTSTSETNAWVDNASHHASIDMIVDATAQSVVILKYDLKQGYSYGNTYSWFRVTVDGTQIGASMNPTTSDSDTFVNHSVDLSAYAGTTFTLKLESSAKYVDDFSMVDNICLTAPTCTPAQVTATLAPDCANTQFYVDVDVTSMGDAVSVSNGTDTWPITGTGVVSAGPFADGSLQDLTVVHADVECDIVLGSFTYVCPPANDLCEDAITVVCDDVVTGSTLSATSTGAPTGFCGTGSGAPGVWYSFMGTGDIVTASLCGSDFDTKIQIYEGTCDALVCVGGNDDNWAACSSSASETLFLSTAGTEYFIYVYGYGSNTGNYTLTMSCVAPPPPPANDDCSEAVDLTVNPDLECGTVTSGTILGGTDSMETDPSCWTTTNDDVWYSFTATSTTHTVSLDNIAGSTTNLDIAVFEGQCGALVEVSCGGTEIAVTGLVVGNSYLVSVHSGGSTPFQDSTFDICVGTPPPPIVTDIVTYTPEELITEVLIDSDCATVTNIQYESHSFDDNIGFSYFTDGGSDFPFADGIVLSSGAAVEAEGPFSNGASGSFGGAGDTDLENETGVAVTNDATYIEFDFVPIAPQISFDFIMASSEYAGSFQCNYEDAFAFILTAADGTTTNLAVLPTTDSGNPFVTVTNIHPEVPGSCAAVNEQYFHSYTPQYGEIGYTGRTVALTAFSPVTPGEQYHIKLVVADQSDSVVDTAVFLLGGSFSLGEIDLGEDVFLGDPEALCEGEISELNAGVIPAGTNIVWTQDGDVVEGSTTVNPDTGETEQILVISETGDYSATVTFDNTDCSVENTVHVEFYPNAIPDLGSNVVKCANEELVLYANVINSDDPNMGEIAYTWSYNGVVIAGETSSELTISATTVVASDNSAAGAVQFVDPINGTTVYASLSSEGVYNLGLFTVSTVDTSSGCVGNESDVQVDFYANPNCVTVPSGISPNNDGVNDCLALDNLMNTIGSGNIQVYNRYGTRVYNSEVYSREWCGTDMNGEVLPTGTYYYVLTYDNGIAPYKGWIYINTEK